MTTTPLWRLFMCASLGSTQPPQVVRLSVSPEKSPRVNELVLEQKLQRAHEVTEQGGQPKDEEELGDGAALEEHAVVSICAVFSGVLRSNNILKRDSSLRVCASFLPCWII